MDRELGQKYRECILEPGGFCGRFFSGKGRERWRRPHGAAFLFISGATKDGDVMLRDFLGRDPTDEAFLKHYQTAPHTPL